MRNKWFLIPLISFILVIVLFRFVIYIGYVPTNSMEPTIMSGDKILGTRIPGELEVGRSRRHGRGDLEGPETGIGG